MQTLPLQMKDSFNLICPSSIFDFHGSIFICHLIFCAGLLEQFR